VPSLACRSAASVRGFVGSAARAGRRRRGGRVHRAAHARGRVRRQPAQIPCLGARQGPPGGYPSGLTVASAPPRACPHARRGVGERAARLRKRARRRGAGRAAGRDVARCGSRRGARGRQRRRVAPGAGGWRARAAVLQRGGQARGRAGGGAGAAGPAGVGVQPLGGREPAGAGPRAALALACGPAAPASGPQRVAVSKPPGCQAPRALKSRGQ